MSHRNPSDPELKALLTAVRTIAMVGASSRADRPSHGVMKRLLNSGYRVIPVNPNEDAVWDQKTFPTLEDVPEKIDLVNVFRRSEHTPEIATQAVKVGAKALWLQEGVVSEVAARQAEAAGLTVVMDRCIAVALSVLGVPPKPKGA